jgi:hypothetical protein
VTLFGSNREWPLTKSDTLTARSLRPRTSSPSNQFALEPVRPRRSTALPPDVRRGSASPSMKCRPTGLCPSYGLWPNASNGELQNTAVRGFA